MALPTPNPNEFDFTKIAEFIGVLITIFTGYLVWINRYFKNKAQERQDFIEAIASHKVDAGLKSFKQEFDAFIDKTENQMSHFNDTLITILKEVKK